MNIVKSFCENEIVIKNSKFIALIYSVRCTKEIENIFKELKIKYKDATHIAYAYKIENREKYSDDKEPSGTAGLPIMKIINRNNLFNTLIVVVRYFGGIKLGASGLIRAYAKASKEVIKKAEIVPYIKYNYYLLTSSYDDLKLLNTLTSGLDITNKSFKDKIVYKVKIKEEEDKILELFKDKKIIVEKL